jgi:hypothetical protein
MIGNNFARLTGSKRNLLALLASSALFTAGCANMATTAPDANPFSSAATLSGNIHGGSQPVVNAVVTLYYAGQKGSSGFPVTPAATTTTDVNGNFTFLKDPTDGDTTTGNTYSCPLPGTVSSPLVYVISKGGNTAGNVTGPSNDGAAFIGVYGSCNKLSASNQLFLNEVTTVATLAVMQQFFEPIGEGITADGTLQQYNVLNNVPNTINLLANTTTGQVVPSTVLKAPVNGHLIKPSVQVTATSESTKINLLANIMSTCINQATATGCAPLFAAAVPGNSGYTSNFSDGTFPAASDTLQAIYYLLTNPSNGGPAFMTATFGLAPGVGAPYQPALATQPTDWTIAINYASTGSTCGTTTGGSGGFISSPSDIAIDFQNNVWIANSQAASGNLSELSWAGIPTTCVFLGSGGLTGVTIDSANPTTTGGNIWVGSGNNMYRFNPLNFQTSTYPVGAGVTPLAVGADGLGNIYFTSAATTSLYQLPLAASTTGVAPLQISNSVGANPIRLMPDFQGRTVASNIFVSSGAPTVSKVSLGAGGLNGYVTTPITTVGNSYGLSLGPDNSLYVSAIDTGAITGLLAGTGGVYTTAVNSNYPFTAATAGIAAPTSISIDGRSNVWIPNNTNGTDASSNPAGSLSYISRDATPLSPATGFQKDPTYLNSSRALAVDQAGNVWVAGDGNTFITEIVGAGVPIFQPYAAGIAVGRFQSIP